MRVALVIVAMLFCAPGFAQGVKLKSVTNSIGMELIEIPAGKFTMGSPRGESGHKDSEAQVSVTLTQPFGLGKYEVTQGQWKEVRGSEPWDGQDNVIADKDFPATYVSWGDAWDFCRNLTAIERESGKLKADEEYDLPTEAEWEYACRAGTTTAFSFGEGPSFREQRRDPAASEEFGEYAWFRGNTIGVGKPCALKVGLKKPNPWGLHDMHGNVWEWCWDNYWSSNTKLKGGTDPTGSGYTGEKVFRGGGWGEWPNFCRSAERQGSGQGRKEPTVGFRVARRQLVK